MPHWAISLNFGLLGHIVNVANHAKFCDNRFRGFGVLIPPILHFSIGIAGRPYNSVSTTVLHCDKSSFIQTELQSEHYNRRDAVDAHWSAWLLMQVFVNLHSAHMDPNDWENPDQFRPERFLDEAGSVIGRDRVIAFSLGTSASTHVTRSIIVQ